MSGRKSEYEKNSALRKQYPVWYNGIVFLILADFALLVSGLLLPVVELSKLGGISGGAYSITQSITGLVRSGEWFLAVVIFLFSAVFPGMKIILLLLVWLIGFSVEGRFRIMRMLHQLSKWSMMDVFVVAIVAGTVQLGMLADAAIRPGLYLFASAIVFSMLLIFMMSRLAIGRQIIEYIPRKPGWRSTMVSLLVIPLFFMGLILPLMEVEKWLFWNKDYSILSACLEMIADGSYALAILYFILVIFLPLFKILGVFFLGLIPQNRPNYRRLETLVLYLDEWAMSDVFALGLCVAVFKISDLVEVQPSMGLWFFLAALALSFVNSLWMGRSSRRLDAES